MQRLLPTGVKLLSSVRDQHGPMEDAFVTGDGTLGDLGSLFELKSRLLSRGPLSMMDGGLLSMMPELGRPSLIKGDYGNQAGLLAKMEMVQELFVDGLIQRTGLARENIKMFFDLVSPYVAVAPIRNLLSPDVKTAANQMSAIKLFAGLDDTTTLSFRNSLRDIRNLVSDPNDFMGRDGAGHIFDSVYLDLLENKLLTSPLGNLRDIARTYFAGLFPFVEDISRVDYVLDDVGSQLGGILQIGTLPVNVVARIIQYKIWLLADVTDMMEGVVISVTDLGVDVVKLGREIVNDVVKLAVVIPQLSVDLLFEMLMIITDVADGLIELPLAVLDLALHLPIELVDIILSIPVSIFDGVSVASSQLLNNFWMQLQSTLNLYDGYSNTFGFPRDQYSLEDFVTNVRGINRDMNDMYGLSSKW